MVRNVESASGSRGLVRIYEFLNSDGRRHRTNCGQAAIATILTHVGVLSRPATVADARRIMTEIEDNFPPDIFFGAFGTSKGRIRQAFEHYGRRVEEIRGKEVLQRTLASGVPVTVMLDVAGDRAGTPAVSSGGHWTVAFAYNADSIFLTNWFDNSPVCAWEKFDLGWNSWLAGMIGMRERRLVVY